MVLDSVDPRVPPGAAPEVERAARHVVTLSTAILVESGNWGDQIETNEARVACGSGCSPRTRRPWTPRRTRTRRAVPATAASRHFADALLLLLLTGWDTAELLP
jgi:hypothetical protein